MLYLIQVYGEDYSLLKIGFSDNLDNRLGQYLDCNPLTKILKTREGGRDLESYLHRHFSKYKYPIKNEWFYYSNEIVNEFDKLELPSKDEMTIEFILTKPLFDDRLSSFNRLLKKNPDKLNLIPEEYRKYLELINNSFRKDVIDKRIERLATINDILNNKLFIDFVYEEFMVDSIYTKKVVKEKLNEVVKRLGYNNVVMKSNLLFNYFNILEVRVTNIETKKRDAAYRILSIKSPS